MMAAGIGIDKLQKLIGHESINTTIKNYGHLKTETLDEAISRLQKFVYN